MIKRLITIIMLLVVFTTHLLAQIEEKEYPVSWEIDNIASVKNVNQYFLDRSTVTSSKKQEVVGGLKFAEVFDVNIGYRNGGQIDTLENGAILWRVKLSSPEAFSLNFTFSRFNIPPQAKVFVYSSNKKHTRGAFTSFNNKNSKLLNVAPIPGDEIIIEYYQPKDVAFDGELEIGTMGHDYLGIFADQKDGNFGKSCDINVDINCAEGSDWQTDKRAVCRMVVLNSELCTGTLINNVKNNGEPLVITANHCIETQYLAERTVYLFNYESAECKGADGSSAHSISGSELLATKNKDSKGFLDYTLVKLTVDVPYAFNPYFAGWDARDRIPESGVCLHHPEGDVKKISVDSNQLQARSYPNVALGYDTLSFWNVVKWEVGTTEGGSSGAALFDSRHRIVGTLTGGSADCDNPINDYFQMFSVSYKKHYQDASTHLKPWLDPDNTGVEYLNGFDPQEGGGGVINKMLLTNWDEEEQPFLYVVKEGDGYVSGNNMFGDRIKADYFDYSLMAGRTHAIGAYVLFGVASGNDNSEVPLKLFSNEQGKPQDVFASSILNLGDIKTAVKNEDYVYYSFEEPVPISSSFYVGVELPNLVGDTVAITTTEDRAPNTAWEFQWEKVWVPYNDSSLSWGLEVSHAIFPVVGNYTNVIDEMSQASELLVYPNPVANYAMIDFKASLEEEIYLRIYNTLGHLIFSQYVEKGKHFTEINTSVWEQGIYIINAQTSSKVYKGKIVKK